MRAFNSLKNRLITFYTYVNNFSKTQAAAGLGAGAGTVYYLEAILEPLINKVAAFAVGTVSGTIIGIVTVYGAEQENIKLIEEKKDEILEAKSLRLKLLKKYYLLKGEHGILEDHQITHKVERRDSLTRNFHPAKFTGGLAPAPEDPIDQMDFEFKNESQLAETQESISYTQKVWRFTKNTNKYQRAVIASYFAMICYYLEYSMDQLMPMELAWGISVLISIPVSPILVYATSSTSQNQLDHLQKRLVFIRGQITLLQSEMKKRGDNLNFLRTNLNMDQKRIPELEMKIDSQHSVATNSQNIFSSSSASSSPETPLLLQMEMEVDTTYSIQGRNSRNNSSCFIL